MNYQELINNLTQSILINIKTALNNEYKCDKTYKAKIIEVVKVVRNDKEIDTNKYKVLINGNTYTATSSIECKVDELVWVCAPCGNINNMFIVCKTK